MSWMRTRSDLDRDMPAERAETPRTVAPAPAPKREGGRNVNIGQSIEIKGTLTGKEDLTIDGKVEGKIRLKEHQLTIGAHGVIQAEVHARTVVIQGQVSGNVTADDKVEIAATGTVRGDIRAPRVAILDGATFQGRIDMEGGAAPQAEKREARPTAQAVEARRIASV